MGFLSRVLMIIIIMYHFESLTLMRLVYEAQNLGYLLRICRPVRVFGLRGFGPGSGGKTGYLLMAKLAVQSQKVSVRWSPWTRH